MNKNRYIYFIVIAIFEGIIYLILDNNLKYIFMMSGIVVLLSLAFLIFEPYFLRVNKVKLAKNIMQNLYYSFLKDEKNLKINLLKGKDFPKKIYQEIESLTSLESKLNRIDGYLLYQPFTLFKKVLLNEGYKKDKDNSFKEILKLNNFYGLTFDFEGKMKALNNLTLFISIDLILGFFLVSIFDFVYSELSKEVYYTLIFGSIFLSFTILYLLGCLFIFYYDERNNIELAFNKFILLFLIHLNFETPYNAFIIASHELNKKYEKIISPLQSSYHDSNINPTLELIKKYPFRIFEDGMLFIFELTIKNAYRNINNVSRYHLISELDNYSLKSNMSLTLFKGISYLLLIGVLVILLENYLILFGY